MDPTLIQTAPFAPAGPAIDPVDGVMGRPASQPAGAGHVLQPDPQGTTSGVGNNLAKLAQRLGIEAKGSLDFIEGVADPDPEQQQRLADYAAADIRITRQVYQALLPQISRPEFELSQMLRHPRTRGTSTLTRLTGSLMPAQITSGGCSLALHGWQVCESPPSRIR